MRAPGCCAVRCIKRAWITAETAGAFLQNSLVQFDADAGLLCAAKPTI